MIASSKDDKYYTVSEVAKIKGIKRQSVIDGCKRGQYPGSYKTEPDSVNIKGLWLIPVSVINKPVMTQDVIELPRQLTPIQVKKTIQEAVREELEPVKEELQKVRLILEAHYRLTDQKIREAAAPKKPWWKVFN